MSSFLAGNHGPAFLPCRLPVWLASVQCSAILFWVCLPILWHLFQAALKLADPSAPDPLASVGSRQAHSPLTTQAVIDVSSGGRATSYDGLGNTCSLQVVHGNTWSLAGAMGG